MPITDTEKWTNYEEKNKDDYGGYCVTVARKAMELLDAEPGDFDCHSLICRADEQEDLTGFMAGCIASMISECHSRGEEFRKKWNKDNQINDEGDKANESGGVLNPAILTIG